MPSQEATILADFLLAPAALRHFLTFKQFTDILPQSYRGNPAVKELYQELQRLRQEDLEVVRSNIVEEVKRSRPLKRECTRARLRDDRAAVAGLDPVALEMEGELAGHTNRRKPHTLQSIHASIEESCKSLESQIEEMESEVQQALAEVQEAVGELSDLRYGTFSKSAGRGDISEEVLATLKRLEAACANPAG